VPWHYHNNVHDTFYVVTGTIRIFLQEPKEEVRLTPGQTYSVAPKRPHLVTNAGDTSAVFLVLQGIGEYDFCAADLTVCVGTRGRSASRPAATSSTAGSRAACIASGPRPRLQNSANSAIY
jgi:hypothetical protein